jgi:hypothetical protein
MPSSCVDRAPQLVYQSQLLLRARRAYYGVALGERVDAHRSAISIRCDCWSLIRMEGPSPNSNDVLARIIRLP